jgi:hypothetical protein
MPADRPSDLAGPGFLPSFRIRAGLGLELSAVMTSNLPRPPPTLPNPYEPMSNDHRWVDALAQGLALIFLLVMFLVAIAGRGPF